MFFSNVELTLYIFFSQLNECVSRLRRVKMEKRILADQGNTLVDLCKVREASKGVFLNIAATENLNKVASDMP